MHAQNPNSIQHMFEMRKRPNWLLFATPINNITTRLGLHGLDQEGGADVYTQTPSHAKWTPIGDLTIIEASHNLFNGHLFNLCRNILSELDACITV